MNPAVAVLERMDIDETEAENCGGDDCIKASSRVASECAYSMRRIVYLAGLPGSPTPTVLVVGGL